MATVSNFAATYGDVPPTTSPRQAHSGSPALRMLMLDNGRVLCTAPGPASTKKPGRLRGEIAPVGDKAKVAPMGETESSPHSHRWENGAAAAAKWAGAPTPAGRGPDTRPAPEPTPARPPSPHPPRPPTRTPPGPRPDPRAAPDPPPPRPRTRPPPGPRPDPRRPAAPAPARPPVRHPPGRRGRQVGRRSHARRPRLRRPQARRTTPRSGAGPAGPAHRPTRSPGRPQHRFRRPVVRDEGVDVAAPQGADDGLHFPRPAGHGDDVRDGLQSVQ